jgi:murein DD-endopeptidase MepM/ murein hydrolase activator NlpD
MSSAGTPAWTLIIVPPTPALSTRRLGLKMRWLRMLGMLMITTVSLAAIWMNAESRISELTAARLAEEQLATAALRDTLQTLRVASVADVARHSPPANMMMPVDAPITSGFSHSRFHPILQIFRAHLGTDFGAAAGTRILAPAAGTVTSVGRRLGYGLTLDVLHSGGITTRYAHCRSALVKQGDHVEMGQAIATVGSSGLATAPHLHFEVLVHGAQVDPIKFLASTHTALAAPVAPPAMPAASR